MTSSVQLRFMTAAALLVTSACGPGSSATDADLVLLNGNIITVDVAGTEVQALASRDGRIVALGSEADIESFVGSGTEVVNLQGRTAIPGFIEGHAHYMRLGATTLEVYMTEHHLTDREDQTKKLRME